jgi:hypothetical protein
MVVTSTFMDLLRLKPPVGKICLLKLLPNRKDDLFPKQLLVNNSTNLVLEH